jgi:hypothetical protein
MPIQVDTPAAACKPMLLPFLAVACPRPPLALMPLSAGPRGPAGLQRNPRPACQEPPFRRPATGALSQTLILRCCVDRAAVPRAG